MNFAKKLLAGSVAASVLAVSAVPTAYAEVSGSVGIASTYLWRGYDLGSGTPAVWGDLNYSTAGFYTGIWGSSGDTSGGSEYDLYIGYGGSAGDFSYDLSLWNYVYPTGRGYDDDGETDIGEWADAVVSLGYGPVSFAAYIPVGKENSSGDYMYYTLGGTMGAFSVLLGLHADNANFEDDNGDTVFLCPSDDEDGVCDSTHLNVSYAYNDNLSFTLSQFIIDESDDDDLKFVVSYSIPIGE